MAHMEDWVSTDVGTQLRQFPSGLLLSELLQAKCKDDPSLRPFCAMIAHHACAMLSDVLCKASNGPAAPSEAEYKTEPSAGKSEVQTEAKTAVKTNAPAETSTRPAIHQPPTATAATSAAVVAAAPTGAVPNIVASSLMFLHPRGKYHLGITPDHLEIVLLPAAGKGAEVRFLASSVQAVVVSSVLLTIPQDPCLTQSQCRIPESPQSVNSRNVYRFHKHACSPEICRAVKQTQGFLSSSKLPCDASRLDYLVCSRLA